MYRSENGIRDRVSLRSYPWYSGRTSILLTGTVVILLIHPTLLNNVGRTFYVGRYPLHLGL